MTDAGYQLQGVVLSPPLEKGDSVERILANG